MTISKKINQFEWVSDRQNLSLKFHFIIHDHVTVEIRPFFLTHSREQMIQHIRECRPRRFRLGFQGNVVHSWSPWCWPYYRKYTDRPCPASMQLIKSTYLIHIFFRRFFVTDSKTSLSANDFTFNVFGNGPCIQRKTSHLLTASTIIITYHRTMCWKCSLWGVKNEKLNRLLFISISIHWWKLEKFAFRWFCRRKMSPPNWCHSPTAMSLWAWRFFHKCRLRWNPTAERNRRCCSSSHAKRPERKSNDRTAFRNWDPARRN